MRKRKEKKNLKIESDSSEKDSSEDDESDYKGSDSDFEFDEEF